MQPFELALCKAIDSLDKVDVAHHVMEPKLDGYRLQVIIAGGAVELFTRTNHVATGKMPAVETHMRDLASALDGTVLDGEAVYLDDDGAADFHFTSSVMGSGAEVAADKQRRAGKYVSFVAFDILALQGNDVRALPLAQRRTLLERVIEAFESDHITLTEQTVPSAEQHELFTKQYGEGSVVKDVRAAYPSGRSKAMLKWKKVAEEDVVVTGMEPGKGKYVGMVGALKFGQYRDGVLVERGQCSGMTDAMRQELTDNLPLGAVLVVTHNGILANGGFRHPQFKAFRSDKHAQDCVWTTEEN